MSRPLLARVFLLGFALAFPSLSRAVTCQTLRTVKQSGVGVDCSSIQTCVSLLQANLTGDACVDVLDSATYSEQVTVNNHAHNGHQIWIGAITGSNQPKIDPPTASTAAFQVFEPSVTVVGVTIVSTNAVQYGVWASSGYVTVSSVNVNDNGSLWGAGIFLSSYSAVSYSSVTAQNAAGLVISGSGSSIAYSSAAVNSASAAAFSLGGGSSNTVTALFAANASGYGARLSATSFNTLSLSTFTSADATLAALFLSQAASNTLAGCYIQGASTAASLSSSDFNAILRSTAATTGGGVSALQAAGSSSNLLSQSLFLSPNGAGMRLQNGSNLNTIAQSTISAAGTAGSVVGAFYVNNSSSNSVTGSYLSDAQGNAAFLESNSSYNTISLSTMWSNASSVGAASVGGTANLVTRSYALNPSGRGAMFRANSSFGTISLSTLTSNGSGANAGIYFNQGSSDTVSGCYIQGSTAVAVVGAIGANVVSNVLAATSNNGYGLIMNGGVNLLFSSNVVQSAGVAGVFIDQNNAGAIVLSTNVILAGSLYGVAVSTQNAGTTVYLTSNTVVGTLTASAGSYGLYMNGLASGATVQDNAFVLRASGGGPGQAYYGFYAQSAGGLNVDHNRLSNPGSVTAGSYVSAYFAGVQNASFKFNDVNSTGTSLTAAYLLQLAGSTVAVRDNVFFSSVTAASSATFMADAASGFDSDYNDFFSSGSPNTLTWGGASHAFPWSASIGKDAHSAAVDPGWLSAAAGVEDFHPVSRAGRYVPSLQGFAQDCRTSATIDAADPVEPFALEASPNGSRANLGSYGGTSQASESFFPAPPAQVAASALAGQVTVSWTPPDFGACPSYVDHYALSYSSMSSSGPYASLGTVSSNTLAFVHSGLTGDTTYYYEVFTIDDLSRQSSPAQAYAVTPDTVAPAATSDLAAGAGAATGQLLLLWTFPGDDNGAKDLPPGSQYAIQYTTDSATVVWSTANAQVFLSTGPVLRGAAQSVALSGLSSPFTYSVRLWTGHPGPYWSAPSNVAGGFSRQAGPSIVSISPADGSSCVQRSTAVVIAFDKPVSGFASAFTLTLVRDSLGNSTSAAVSGAISPPVASAASYTFTPISPLDSNGTYAAVVSTSLLDLAGNPLALAATVQFVTVMDRTAPNVALPLFGLSVSVPAGALTSDGCVAASTTSLSANIGTANAKLSASGDPFRRPISGSIVDFKAYDGSGGSQNSFGSALTLSLPYPDADGDGIVDGTNPPVKASTLGVWWLDETSASWYRLPSSSVDAAAKTVSAGTTHFTTFAIIGQEDTSLANAYAYPVPYEPSRGHDKIIFVTGAQSATIKIYTSAGELVQTLQAGFDGVARFSPVVNSRGQSLASDVYFYVIESPTDKKTGKLVIVR